MPLQNRVTPLGELIAHPARGLVYGNRGCLHDDVGRIRRSFAVKRWIACRLEFKGRRRPLLRPGRFTELFFLDEATAFAAGHRPCAECRREDYVRFRSIWTTLHSTPPRAEAMDEQLHLERIDPSDGSRRLHGARARELPDGAFLLLDDAPFMVMRGHALRWTPAGYTDRIRILGSRRVQVITPPSLVAVLRAGWESALPLLHPSCRG